MWEWLCQFLTDPQFLYGLSHWPTADQWEARIGTLAASGWTGLGNWGVCTGDSPEPRSRSWSRCDKSNVWTLTPREILLQKLQGSPTDWVLGCNELRINSHYMIWQLYYDPPPSRFLNCEFLGKMFGTSSIMPEHKCKLMTSWHSAMIQCQGGGANQMEACYSQISAYTLSHCQAEHKNLASSQSILAKNDSRSLQKKL